MIIALDYDETYSEDPDLWDVFARLAIKRGHEVFIVTARHYHEQIRVSPPWTAVIHYTGRSAKKQYLEKRGIKVDIWIDDRPEFVHNDHGSLLDWE